MESEYFTEDVHLEGQIDVDNPTIQTDNSQADEYTQDRAQAIGMTGLTNMIQEELHKAVENFIGQRVDQINIKFYDVEKKNKADKPRKAPRKSKTGTEIRGKAKRVR